MTVLYIGHYNEGSTSKMRGEYLKKLLPNFDFTVINIDNPLQWTPRLLRSIGWRYKFGPLIKNINDYIENSLKGKYDYTIVWIDKGVFILPKLVRDLKINSGKLVHFTPDPAFTYHRSNLFYKSLPLYDYCITTKSFEIQVYEKYGVKTILCTQGYDPFLHKSYHDFSEKRGVVFIGHKEDERESIIAKLLESRVPVTLAGNHWDKFAKRRRNNRYLDYRGKGIYGLDYAKAISSAKMGLGFLSKWIPELHTTRTFEIPACGTALITERNLEINSIFDDNEAIFYDSVEDVVEKVPYYLDNGVKLKDVTENGHRKIIEGAYNYPGILKRILTQIGF